MLPLMETEAVVKKQVVKKEEFGPLLANHNLQFYSSCLFPIFSHLSCFTLFLPTFALTPLSQVLFDITGFCLVFLFPFPHDGTKLYFFCIEYFCSFLPGEKNIDVCAFFYKRGKAFFFFCFYVTQLNFFIVSLKRDSP